MRSKARKIICVELGGGLGFKGERGVSWLFGVRRCLWWWCCCCCVFGVTDSLFDLGAGVEVKPGKPFTHIYDDSKGRLHVSMVIFNIL